MHKAGLGPGEGRMRRPEHLSSRARAQRPTYTPTSRLSTPQGLQRARAECRHGEAVSAPAKSLPPQPLDLATERRGVSWTSHIGLAKRDVRSGSAWRAERGCEGRGAMRASGHGESDGGGEWRGSRAGTEQMHVRLDVQTLLVCGVGGVGGARSRGGRPGSKLSLCLVRSEPGVTRPSRCMRASSHSHKPTRGHIQSEFPPPSPTLGSPTVG